MPDLQKAQRSETPWPWVAGKLARGDTIVAEPRWNGLRAQVEKRDGTWHLSVMGKSLPWPFEPIPEDAPSVALDGVLLMRQGSLWLAKADMPSVLMGKQEAHVRFVAFDCVREGDDDLSQVPHASRRKVLDKAASQMGPQVVPSPLFNVSGKVTFGAIEAWSALHQPSHGAILKSCQSAYGESDTWLLIGPEDPEPERDRPAMRLVKAEAMAQKVVGVVFEPETEDTQGDVTAASEIEAAAHQFLADYRAGLTELWLNHDTRLSDADVVLVENYIAPEAMTVGGQLVKRGSWLQVWHVKNAGLWQMVLDGELTGFSFGGTGLRGPLKKQAALHLRVERDRDGRATRFVTPRGTYKACYDEHRRFVGAEKVA